MKQRILFGFVQNVFILSFISFLNDIGGETIKRAIPLFLTNVLSVPTTIVGLVEGVTESVPQLFQPLSGYISDHFQKRKPLVLIGQIIRAAMIFLFFANSWIQVLIVRFLDRSAKGITTAPRDALISVSTDKKDQGRAFGLSRAMDNGGAVVGLTIAGILTLSLWSGKILLTRVAFQQIVLLAIIPQIIAVVLIFLFVRDLPVATHTVKKDPLRLRSFPKFTGFLVVAFIFTLGNSSDAFLILKAQQQGISIPVIFFLLAAMSLFASLTNIPAGIISDRRGRKLLLTVGWLWYGAVYVGFSLFSSPWIIGGLFIAYGLYYGLTEGAAKAMVADLVDSSWKGTAYGLYNVTTGLTLLLSSLIAGVLWQSFTPAVAFSFGAFMSLIAVAGLHLVLPKPVHSV